MSDDAPPKKSEASAGAPAWVMTFADLMSLLMCFFVLLLAFSEMDVQKFKQLSGSVKQAFGVQRQIRAHEIPKGTSTVAKEFSAGKPQPTVLNQVKQQTTDTNKKVLDATEVMKEKVKATEEDARRIAQILEEEIKEGKIEIETENTKIIIRILERGSFPSGADTLNESFMPVMNKIKNVLTEVDGEVKISGHTDDLPISTARFRSNWELSASRAVSVAHALLEGEKVEQDRFEIIGYADTRPRVANDSEDNRSKNRRVEIIIEQGKIKKKKASVAPEGEVGALLPMEEEFENDGGSVEIEKKGGNEKKVEGETVKDNTATIPLGPISDESQQQNQGNENEDEALDESAPSSPLSLP